MTEHAGRPASPAHRRTPPTRGVRTLGSPLDGRHDHAAFRDAFSAPPYFVDHGAGTLAGPRLIPLWGRGDVVVGVWGRPGGPESIEFSIEAVDDPTPLARTEQGFWTAQFDLLYEYDLSLAELREAAGAVGFRFVESHLSARQAAEPTLTTFEGHEAWLRDLVAGIDRDSGGPA